MTQVNNVQEIDQTTWSATTPLDNCPEGTWIFTDGATRANGKAECRASYAYYITNSTTAIIGDGTVPPVDISGEVYKSSNIRAELLAIYHGINASMISGLFNGPVTLVTDSKFSIQVITEWYPEWIRKGILGEKKNIVLTTAVVNKYAEHGAIIFKHVNSHTKRANSSNVFWWDGNDLVDKRAGAVLL